ncbi:MAG: GWxTD domain-containing protein [candidate division WOR-3 bacterium]
MPPVLIPLLVFAAFDSLRFDFDWALFHHKGDSARVEFYYGIAYDQLNFQEIEDYLTAFFNVSFEMNGLDNQFRESGTIQKRARIRSFQEAAATQRTFIDQFSVIASPGLYEVKVTVFDSVHSGMVIDTIRVPNFNEGGALSSIQLGSGIFTDSTTGGFAVIPNPGRRFLSGERRKIYAYFETYGLKPDSQDYQVRYHLIKTNRRDTLLSSAPIPRRKTAWKGAVCVELTIDSLMPDSYLLVIDVSDASSNQILHGERELTIASTIRATGDHQPYQFTITPREERYYRELQYIATPGELAYYQTLSDSGKEAYLAWFWSRHNLTEFVRRMETAENRFKTARTPGVKTDRGRIYVKYGEPDAVERKTIEMEIKPREYWFYYQEGLKFIFIDLRGDGNYRLVWSNSPDEPSTGLEHLLTPQEQEEFH